MYLLCAYRELTKTLYAQVFEALCPPRETDAVFMTATVYYNVFLLAMGDGAILSNQAVPRLLVGGWEELYLLFNKTTAQTF